MPLCCSCSLSHPTVGFTDVLANPVVWEGVQERERNKLGGLRLDIGRRFFPQRVGRSHSPSPMILKKHLNNVLRHMV